MISAFPYLVLVAAAVGLAGCSAAPRAPSKYDIPVNAIAHVQALGAKQKFILCSTCPEPTPKTMAIPLQDSQEASSKSKSARPKFTYISPPAVDEKLTTNNFKFSIPFAYKRFTLDEPRGRKALAELIGALNEMDIDADVGIVAHGYTDDIGSEKYNRALGLRRANTVVEELRKAGIRRPLSAISKGECCFITNNEDDERRAANRRVEVVFVKRK